MKYTTNWDVFEREMRNLAKQANSEAGAYEVIRKMLLSLDDKHSFLIVPEPVNKIPKSRKITGLTANILDLQIGYISLPRFGGFDDDHLEEYATKTQSLIRDIDATVPIGWIVDLRENRGGNMWPMLAGIGPLLGAEHVGSFVDPDGKHEKWFYKDGKSWCNEDVIVGNGQFHNPIQHGLAPVAVLISPDTKSSGEAITIAFKGRPKTRFFGQPSGGLSTANNAFELSDGAVLALTVATFADRTGKLYGSKIMPDVTVTPEDNPIQVASRWIKKMNGRENNQ
ncbi:MAG: S41 family peptidase [Chloroflexota bacterium]